MTGPASTATSYPPRFHLSPLNRRRPCTLHPSRRLRKTFIEALHIEESSAVPRRNARSISSQTIVSWVSMLADGRIRSGNPCGAYSPAIRAWMPIDNGQSNDNPLHGQPPDGDMNFSPQRRVSGFTAQAEEDYEEDYDLVYTFIEIFYQWTSTALGMKHYGVWNDSYFSPCWRILTDFKMIIYLCTGQPWRNLLRIESTGKIFWDGA